MLSESDNANKSHDLEKDVQCLKAELEKLNEYVRWWVAEFQTQLEHKPRRYEFEYPQSDKDYD